MHEGKETAPTQKLEVHCHVSRLKEGLSMGRVAARFAERVGHWAAWGGRVRAHVASGEGGAGRGRGG